MTPEKQKKIFEVYGVTQGPWDLQRGEEINPSTMLYVCHEETQCEETTVCNFDETDYRKDHFANANLIANSPSMLIKLWELLDFILLSRIVSPSWVVADEYQAGLESFLSSLHPESLPFDEIFRKVEG